MIHWYNMCMLKETKCDTVEIRNKISEATPAFANAQHNFSTSHFHLNGNFFAGILEDFSFAL